MTAPDLPTAAILVGGRSRRMGSDKALVDVGGKPMIEWTAAAVRTVVSDVIGVGRRDRAGSVVAVPDDALPTAGTLAGLVTALRRSPTSVLLIAVDQPWLRADTLRELIAIPGEQPVVPSDQNTRQVTCAIYPQAVLGEAEEEANRGGSIQSLLDRIEHVEVDEASWRVWGEDGRSWFSVDTPQDVGEGLKRYGIPAG